MKKIVIILLLLLMCPSIIACKSNDYTYYDPVDIVPEVITIAKAKQLAREYVENGYLDGILALFSAAYSVKYVDVASSDSSFKFTVKGSFFAYDDYGELEDIYLYEAELTVSDTGKVTHGYQPKIQKK